MKAIGIAILSLAAIGAAVWLAGCSGGGSLGSEQSAGPFKVSLTTSPQPPTAGGVTLTVRVVQDGAAVQGATVQIESSMPSMNMPGPSLDLQPSGDGYSTSMNLMAGEWEVKVNVAKGTDKGSATFKFEAK